MKQLDLDGLEVGYTCKCGKSFDTMSKLKKHHAKAHKKKRESIQINFVLENFKMISVKKTEMSFIPNFDDLGMVSQ